MINSIQRQGAVEMLLNSLEAERHVRGPLLFTLLDELSAFDALEPAADAARALLARIEAGPVDQAWFEAQVDELRKLTRALMPRPSGVVAADPASAAARLSPGPASAA